MSWSFVGVKGLSMHFLLNKNFAEIQFRDLIQMSPSLSLNTNLGYSGVNS